MIDLTALRAAFPGRRIDFYPEIDSTMNAAVGLPLGSVVLADRQTAGIGRHGHSWHSEPSNGVYCSIVLSPSPVLTLALGVATVEAIAHAYGIVCDIRWPNDLMLDGKKVAGILVQLSGGGAIAGIGINVNHTLFPPELENEATSLCIYEGKRLSRERVVRELLPAVDAMAGQTKESVLALFTRASSYVSGRRVIVHQPGGKITGTTAGLNADGYLILRRDDGTEALILAGGVRALSA